MKGLLLFLFSVQLLYSCKKSNESDNCQSLKVAILNDDIATTEILINSLIEQLRNKTYTELNLNALIQRISTQCDVSSTVLCFDCIKRLPSQSEIKISISSAGTVVVKTIDISYSNSYTMTFRNMHQ